MVFEQIFGGIPVDIPKILYILKLLFWFGLLAVAAWFGGRAYLYNVRVILLERRGKSGHVLGLDTARVKKDKEGVLKLSLLKSRALVDLPGFEPYFHLKWAMMQKSGVFIERYAEKSYRVLNPEEVLKDSVFKLVVTEADMSLLMSIRNELKEKHDWRDWLTKWLPLILNIAMFAILIVMLIFVVNGVEKIVPAFNHAADTFSVAADKLSECTVQPATLGS